MQPLIVLEFFYTAPPFLSRTSPEVKRAKQPDITLKKKSVYQYGEKAKQAVLFHKRSYPFVTS
ncbi:MAG: hypothetical protein CSA20_09080 [Deltaproteobacteria bacterium]|nr:MAG: hypothetical protein CSA20_09080 [Deltaproteobacteria bacterium]